MCRRATPGGRRVGTEFERNKAGGSRYYLNTPSHRRATGAPWGQVDGTVGPSKNTPTHPLVWGLR
jgi:hypothetical protein